MKNMNELATRITLLEGGKKNTNVAQVKEVLRHLSDLMAKNPAQIMMLLLKAGQRRKKSK